MASASEVFPAPALEIKTTFLSDSLCGSLMGSSFCQDADIWFVSFVWLKGTNQMNQINQINNTNQMNQAFYIVVAPLSIMRRHQGLLTNLGRQS
jgi:hypothetical protein